MTHLNPTRTATVPTEQPIAESPAPSSQRDTEAGSTARAGETLVVDHPEREALSARSTTPPASRLGEKYGLADPGQRARGGVLLRREDAHGRSRAEPPSLPAVEAADTAPAVEPPALAALDAATLEQLRPAFPTAALASKHAIPDPFTEGGTNSTYLAIYDAESKLLGYLRKVATTTGCQTMCMPLEFALALGPERQFLRLVLEHPLTKIGHEEFTAKDYAKLDDILRGPPMSYLTAGEPSDLVDAVTSATLPLFKNEVVPTAALTCFRIYQYETQTMRYLQGR